MTLGKRTLLAAIAVWLLVPSAETITGAVRADPPATSPPPAWHSEVRRVKVATPTGEQVKEITFQKNSLGMEDLRSVKSKFLSAKVKSCCSEGGSPSSLGREAPEFRTKELDRRVFESMTSEAV